jgi:hypothetical protein
MNQLAVYMPNSEEMTNLQVIARSAATSGLYNGIGSEQKILMIILYAREMGIPVFQALNGGVWNIQGKIEISARLMAAMIRRAGHSMKVTVCNENECTIEGTRSDNGDTFSASFTMKDAQKAGLAGRGSWKSYAEDMLYARAMSRLGRRLFPDVIGTAYVEGEIRDSQMKVADYEEVPTHASGKVEKAPVEGMKQLEDKQDEEVANEEIICKEQVQVIEDILNQCAPKCVASFNKYLQKEGIDCLETLPLRLFEHVKSTLTEQRDKYQGAMNELAAAEAVAASRN